MQNPYLNVQDVARLFGVTAFTVRHWLKKGLLPGRRVGDRGHWRIDPADLESIGRRS